MSIRFKSFLTRVGKDCEFKPLNNALLNYLTKESENKYKNYPRLLNLMKKYWPKYQDRSRISHLLKDHFQEIFGFYLTTMFPFRKGGLELEDPEAPTPVDFKLVYKYHYNLKEKFIELNMNQINNIGSDIQIKGVYIIKESNIDEDTDLKGEFDIILNEYFKIKSEIISNKIS